MNEAIRTLSGSHPYRPQCVTAAARDTFIEWVAQEHIALEPDVKAKVVEQLTLDCAERFTIAVDRGICPRCSGPLLPDNPPDDWRPAGTRALPCRCVPICETCASWIEPLLGALPVTAWPTNEYEVDDDRTRKDMEDQSVARLKATAHTAYLELGGDEPVIFSATGVTTIQPRPNPGGWLEHGYDDEADRREREA